MNRNRNTRNCMPGQSGGGGESAPGKRGETGEPGRGFRQMSSVMTSSSYRTSGIMAPAANGPKNR